MSADAGPEAVLTRPPNRVPVRPIWYTKEMSLGTSGLPRLPVTPPATVFISHSSRDQPLVRWLAEQVKASGHRAWVAEWELEPGAQLSDKVLSALDASDAYILLLTEDGYDSVYVAHEVGAAVASRKPLIALVDHMLADKPMGLLTDVEQVRFDPTDLAASTAAITAGLTRLGQTRGASVAPGAVMAGTQPALFSLSLQMDAQFHITANQVFLGLCALMLIGGLIYLANHETDVQ